MRRDTDSERSHTIPVVDDSVDEALLVKHWVAEAGYRVVQAHSRAQVLPALRATRASLIVLGHVGKDRPESKGSGTTSSSRDSAPTEVSHSLAQMSAPTLMAQHSVSPPRGERQAAISL